MGKSWEEGEAGQVLHLGAEWANLSRVCLSEEQQLSCCGFGENTRGCFAPRTPRCQEATAFMNTMLDQESGTLDRLDFATE